MKLQTAFETNFVLTTQNIHPYSWLYIYDQIFSSLVRLIPVFHGNKRYVNFVWAVFHFKQWKQWMHSQHTSGLPTRLIR